MLKRSKQQGNIWLNLIYIYLMNKELQIEGGKRKEEISRLQLSLDYIHVNLWQSQSLLILYFFCHQSAHLHLHEQVNIQH